MRPRIRTERIKGEAPMTSKSAQKNKIMDQNISKNETRGERHGEPRTGARKGMLNKTQIGTKTKAVTTTRMRIRTRRRPRTRMIHPVRLLNCVPRAHRVDRTSLTSGIPPTIVERKIVALGMLFYVHR
jgi:hypothetical protein